MAGLAVSLLEGAVRLGAGGVWVAELLAQALFATVPVPVFRIAVGLLGFAAKWVALGAMVALHAAAAAALAAAIARTLEPRGPGQVGSRRSGLLWPGLAFGLAQWLAVSLLLGPARLVPHLSGPLAHGAGRLLMDLGWGVAWAALARAWMLLRHRPARAGAARAGASGGPANA